MTQKEHPIKMLIERYAREAEGKWTPFFVEHDCFEGKLPKESVLLIDQNVTRFVKDGLYLISDGDSSILTRIQAGKSGGFDVCREGASIEHFENLDSLKIVGNAKAAWAPVES